MQDYGIPDKANAALAGSGYAALLVTGADNVQYLGGAHLPFLASRRDRPAWLIWPAGGEPAIVCPAAWASSAQQLGWVPDVVTYPATVDGPAAAVLAAAELLLKAVPPAGRVGIDLERVPASTLAALRARLPDHEFAGCDDWLRSLRMVKTAAELRLLEDAAARTDHGILAAVHHQATRGVRTEKFFAEDIRVHCLERLLDIVGYHAVSLAASGEHARKFWPLAPRYGLGWDRTPLPGEWVRMGMRATLRGYWSDATRLLVMGEPTPEQSAAYNQIVHLRQTMLALLLPGRRCSDIFRAVAADAQAAGIALVPGLGIGHGVGVTPYEAPFLSAGDETELQPGMVLGLSPTICATGGEILCSIDTVIIRTDGPEIIGWFKDWREPYITAYTF